MRFLILPTCFPRPESMGQGDIAVWTNWIREETDEIMKQLEEERDSRSDSDDPFNGTANVVFYPCKIRYHCPLQYRHQSDKKTTARIQNLFKIRRKTSEDRPQREKMKEQMKQLPLHKESHANFKNILENRWTQWQVFGIYIFNRDKTDIVYKN